MSRNVLIITLGCAKNTCDSENMAFLLKEAGFKIVDSSDKADYVIVNTCGFIEAAKTESVGVIFDAVKIKKERPGVKIVVTGCLSQRYAEEIAEGIPEADYILGAMDLYDIAEILSGQKEPTAGKHIYRTDNDAPLVETGRQRLDDAPYAYIKIAEGCDRRCTYCAIPLIRGKQRSRRIEDICSEAEAVVSAGAKELVIVAQDTGEYGTDNYGRRMIVPLIRMLASIEGLRQIRLMYVYPEAVDEELIDAYRTEDKLVKYIDIPFQHVSSHILKRMGRGATRETVRGCVEALRQAVPGIAIRSTFMTGFPGETEEDVDELIEFLKEYKLTRAGVFVYSREEGTAAADFPDQIEEDVKQARYERVMEAQRDISSSVMESFIGTTLSVLVEEEPDEPGGYYSGLSYLDAPEVDGEVYFTSEQKLRVGDYADVTITDSTEYDFWGQSK